MEELIGVFSTENSQGLINRENGGEFSASTTQNGKKICHLLTNFKTASFKCFELTIYCNYTTEKILCLFSGVDSSLSAKINVLGKNGDQTFSLKYMNGEIFVEANSNTTMLEVRLKPLFGLLFSDIVMKIDNNADLSNAVELAIF